MNQKQPQRKSKKLLIIQKLGLQKFFIDNFIFRPPQIGYTIEKDQKFDKLTLYILYDKQKLELNNRLLEIHPLILIKGKNLYVPLAYIKHKLSLESNEFVEEKDQLVKEFLDEQKKAKLLVIYSHGNASDLGDVYFFAEKFATLYSVDILIYDYTGYGLGKGKYQISEQQIYDDLQSVLAYAVVELQYCLNQIVLIGFSMGSGPTVEIATRYQNLGGVVLLAPLASVMLCIDRKRDFVKWDEDDLFKNINKIHVIACPILIVHGTIDSIIDVRHSKLLYQQYQNHCKAKQQRIQLLEITNINHSEVHDLLFNDQCEVSQRTYFFLTDIFKFYSEKRQLNLEKQEEIKRCYKLLELIKEEIQQSNNNFQDSQRPIQVITQLIS